MVAIEEEVAFASACVVRGGGGVVVVLVGKTCGGSR